LPTDDHARIVRRQVDQLDRTVIDRLYQGRGDDAFDPIALLKMVLYQYLKGRRSPATWEEEARLNEAMQWLGNGYTPARCKFRVRNSASTLSRIVTNVLRVTFSLTDLATGNLASVVDSCINRVISVMQQAVALVCWPPDASAGKVPA